MSGNHAHCVVCGATDGRVICRRAAFDGVLCACGAVFLSPPVSPDAACDPTVDLHPDGFYRLPADAKVRWLSQSYPRGRLLEVGCGGGHFLAAAKAHGYEVAAIEPHAERASHVAARLGVDVECALIEESRAPAGSFDVVYHCDLLSHFPDPERALLRMRDLLRVGGALFFEVGAWGHIAPYWYQKLSEDEFPKHRWLYSEEALDRLLGRCGLRVVRRKRFSLGPHVLAYSAASALVQTSRRLRRGVRSAASSPNEPRAETPAEAWWHNFMRFKIGAVAPRFGPQTLFVLASPEA
jgi:SAM-dependent methyltransferase